MNENDYFMKQVRQMVQVMNQIIATVLKLKNQDQPAEIIQSVDTLMKDQFSFDLNTIIEYPDEELIERLKKDYDLNDEVIALIGDLLFEIAHSGQDAYPKLKLFKKSLIIYKYMETSSEIYSIDRHLRIEQILSEHPHLLN